MNAFCRTFPKYLAIAIDNARSLLKIAGSGRRRSRRRGSKSTDIRRRNRHMLIFVSLRLITSTARKVQKYFSYNKVSQSLVKLVLSRGADRRRKNWKRREERKRDNEGPSSDIIWTYVAAFNAIARTVRTYHRPSPDISLHSNPPTSNSTSFFGKRRPYVRSCFTTRQGAENDRRSRIFHHRGSNDTLLRDRPLDSWSSECKYILPIAIYTVSLCTDDLANI